MIDASGKKSNAKVEFALSGWTNLVAKDTQKNDETATTYAKILQLVLDNTVKQLILK